MNFFDDVLNDFKDGNYQQRLDLYMCHRNLRSDFDQIEDEESASMKTEITDSQQVVIKSGKTNEQQPLLVKMKRWCFSMLS